ncbi:MAG: ParB/RepB/Spo0J family partition protein [Planctomycetes bacterium]|nr:ParB/RepB/Spo0J family partition protein [Planctomycetota bacterium]
MKQPRASKNLKKIPAFIEGLKATEVVDVAIEDISRDDTYQYRLSAVTGDLKDSLLREGQREPVDLVGSKPYKIVDGFRRVEATRQIGWKTVKAFVHHRMSADEAQRLAFLKNVVRKNLSPLDKANAIRQAKKRGNSLDQLAKDFGISVKQVRRYEGLLDLSSELQRLVDKGHIPMSHAIMLHDYGVRNVEKWAEIIKEKKLTRLQLKRELRKATGVKPVGRKKNYVKLDRTSVRLYPFAMSKETPREERENVAKMLEEAADALRGW